MKFLILPLLMALQSACLATSTLDLKVRLLNAVALHDLPTALASMSAMKSRGVLAEHAFDVARRLRDTLNEHLEMSPDDKAGFDKLKDLLPTSVKNVVFAASVCIRNVFFDEYLFAPTDDFLYDTERRHVFTWVQDGPPPSGTTWTFEESVASNEFKILNSFDEYLFVTEWNLSLPRDRRVYTWLPSWTNGTQQNFELRPDGDYVILLNADHNNGGDDEFVYASETQYHDADRRTVYQWYAIWLSGENHLWEVTDCSA